MIGFSVTNFNGLLPIQDSRKLPDGAAVEAVDCDLQASDLRTFSPLKELSHVASVAVKNSSGFVFNENQMFIFREEVEATYGPVRAAEEIDNRVFIGSGFQDWPVYSTKRLGLPTPISTYFGPPINWRKLGVIPGPVKPTISVPQPLNGIGTLYAGSPTTLLDDSGGPLTINPGPGDSIVTGSRIKITGAENEGWDRVNNNVYVVERDVPPTGVWSAVLLRGLDTTDLMADGDVDGSELVNGSGGPFTVSDSVNWQQEFEISQVEDRFYVYTLVTELGEEGAPSLPSDLVSVGEGQVVTIQTPTTIDDPFRFYTHKRIYRTIPTSTGTARYFFVEEIPISQTIYEDSKDVIELGEELPSLEWLPPPDGLQGLLVLPNGVMAGFVDRTLYLSEPYQPHAYPPRYTKNMDNPIVGIAAFGQQLVVATEENPYIGTATDPLSMTFAKLETVEPCVSKRSIQSMGYAVIYPSPNGLMVVSPGGVSNALTKLWDEKAWRLLFTANTDNFAIVHDGKYYLTFYNEPTNVSTTFIFDPREQYLQISQVTADTCSGMIVDRDEDRLYWLATRTEPFGARLLEWNPDPDPESNEAVWMSQAFVMPIDINLGAIQVFYNKNETGTITIEFVVDGVSRYTHTVTTDEPERLPGGFLGRDWQIRVRATKSVQAIFCAETIGELRGALSR